VDILASLYQVSYCIDAISHNFWRKYSIWGRNFIDVSDCMCLYGVFCWSEIVLLITQRAVFIGLYVTRLRAYSIKLKQLCVSTPTLMHILQRVTHVYV